MYHRDSIFLIHFYELKHFCVNDHGSDERKFETFAMEENLDSLLLLLERQLGVGIGCYHERSDDKMMFFFILKLF